MNMNRGQTEHANDAQSNIHNNISGSNHLLNPALLASRICKRNAEVLNSWAYNCAPKLVHQEAMRAFD